MGDYSLSILADDVAAIMDDALIENAAVAGVSLGGMVAMELALAHAERVSALALICTSATMDRASWAARIDTVRTQGTQAIAQMAVGRFLSAPFIQQHTEVADRLRRAIPAQSDNGYAGAGAAIREMALSDRIGDIAVPTLVVTGEADMSTPYAGHGEYLMAHVPGARRVAVAGAHLPPIEAPAALAAALRSFLTGDEEA